MSNPLRPNQAPIKVVGVGEAKTGTFSLCHALEILGFGPCFHPLNPHSLPKWREWTRVLEGETDPEFIDSILAGYSSAADSPAALNAGAIYNAYPDAKYILTTRGPHEYEQSIKKNFGNALKDLSADKLPDEHQRWILAAMNIRFNGQRPSHDTDFKAVLAAHNERIKKLIPSNKLLIFDVKEGWGPLVEFLGVPEPKEPFPKVNESKDFAENARKAAMGQRELSEKELAVA